MIVYFLSTYKAQFEWWKTVVECNYWNKACESASWFYKHAWM